MHRSEDGHGKDAAGTRFTRRADFGQPESPHHVIFQPPPFGLATPHDRLESEAPPPDYGRAAVIHRRGYEMDDVSHQRNWLTQKCRDHFPELVVSLLLMFVGGLGTAIIGGYQQLDSIAKDSALTSKDVSFIRESLDNLKTGAQAQAQHLEKHDDALSAHGERLSALEASKR